MKLSASDLEQIAHTGFLHSENLKGEAITGVCTDSREAKSGDLFVAIAGETHDGHAFLRDAFTKGAVAAIVRNTAEVARDAGWPLLMVDDTVKGLGDLALSYRRKFSIPVLAVAGSNGKTTCKEMIAAVLQKTRTVLSTEGNFNNQIGVPKTLFRLEPQHEVAVVEIGTNHPGELRELCRVLEPTHGLITGIGHEHLEFFRTLEGVAREEGTLFEVLRRRRDGTVFVNADDRRVAVRARGIAGRLKYGTMARGVDVRGAVIDVDGDGRARLRCTHKKARAEFEVRLRVPGIHSVTNALAAAAVGFAFGVPAEAIRDALDGFQPASKRMEVLSRGGVRILNDTYNANPDSMIAALQTLASMEVTGKRIAVLGDMLELGAVAMREHARIGGGASRLHLDYLLTYGALAKHIHDAARGMFTVHYDQKNVLAEYLTELVAPGDAVLVKGSRGMHMEDIVTFLTERLHASAALAG